MNMTGAKKDIVMSAIIIAICVCAIAGLLVVGLSSGEMWIIALLGLIIVWMIFNIFRALKAAREKKYGPRSADKYTRRRARENADSRSHKTASGEAHHGHGRPGSSRGGSSASHRSDSEML